ncbi:MAG: bifunctional riboflavin kinase/FAD synthetase [Bacteroidetes bacterium]|nr:bifunctional riboflavin kinase/FAD synthetase [Bacteroidota bacterium]
MKEYSSASSYNNTRPSAVTIGTFDGVHLGHRAILERLVKTATDENLDSVLLTFFPHPRMVLQKDVQLKLINTIDERKELIKKTGLDQLVIHPFTKEFSRLTALQFVRDILVNCLNVKKIIIGYDHRFGRNRNATIEDLKEFGITYDFEVIEITAQELDEVAISSSKIRRALENGHIKTANSYLGYLFMLNGTIVKGKGIGKTLDFPTANLQVEENYKIIPKNGVYVVQTNISGERVFGITNIGTNPTFGGSVKTIETYFLDFNEILYGKFLKLEFLKRIRDEVNFETSDNLKEAIKKDESFAREYIKSNE